MPIAPVNSSALFILQQARGTGGAADDGPAGITDVTGFAGNSAGSPFTQVRAKISDAMFSVNNVDATEMKVRLIERLGEEFGIKRSDYKSMTQYSADIKRAVDALKAKPGSALAITAIEKKLGLDKLGVTLDDLVDAAVDPNGRASEKLDAALRKQAGDASKGTAGPLRLDEIGIYGR
ncbi:MAG: hypothetical protein J0I79_13610 [Mesorhizobium sp.]|uniref:hypothetical protein n=1 Tax=Mesorhizobium sp. TaxID=1871066 RepID=UPI001ACE67F2|nr:hypothetical protein [Mesorhizobium sp.]MBN9218984.1 hypothetical protein [Mesorhizobium sp.]